MRLAARALHTAAAPARALDACGGGEALRGITGVKGGKRGKSRTARLRRCYAPGDHGSGRNLFQWGSETPTHFPTRDGVPVLLIIEGREDVPMTTNSRVC